MKQSNTQYTAGQLVAMSGRSFRLRRPARDCYYWEAVQLDGHPACAGSIQIIDQRKFAELAFGDGPPAALIGMLDPKCHG